MVLAVILLIIYALIFKLDEYSKVNYYLLEMKSLKTGRVYSIRVDKYAKRIIDIMEVKK
jgi:hypothetical protein